jgi:acyl-CoA synthetase (NDP forming)
MEIWTDSQMASIHKMLNPRSIAVIGATPRLQYGGRFLATALKAKDRVRVYAVNPRYDVDHGHTILRQRHRSPRGP